MLITTQKTGGVVMKTNRIAAVCIIGMVFFINSLIAHAKEGEPVKLPAPQTTGGKPLMQALKERIGKD